MEVDTLGVGLGNVTGKLDGIMSLLSGMTSGQDRPRESGGPTRSNVLMQPQNNVNHVVGRAGVTFDPSGGGGSSGSGDARASFVGPATPTTTFRGGGGCGYGQFVGPRMVGGGFGQVGQDGLFYGPPVGNFVNPRFPMEQQQGQQPPPRSQGPNFFSQNYQQLVPMDQPPTALNQVKCSAECNINRRGHSSAKLSRDR